MRLAEPMVFLAAAAALLLATQPANAQASFNVQTRFDSGCSATSFTSGFVGAPVSHSDSCGDSEAAAALFASSSFGVVRSSTSSSSNTEFGSSQATALARFSDVITFTKTDPSAPDIFTVSLNLNLDGILNAGQGVTPSNDVPLDSRAGYSFAVQGDFGSFFGLGTFSTIDGVIVIPSGLGDNFGVVVPGPNGFAAALRSPQATFDFAGGTTLNASLFIALESFAHSRADGGSPRADFSSSFGFPSGTDVFNLPDGYTANAGDYLVDNRFADPNGVGAIPEPATWVMLIIGFGLTGGVVRGRRKASERAHRGRLLIAHGRTAASQLAAA